MVIFADSLKNKVTITIKKSGEYYVQRMQKGIVGWLNWDGEAFSDSELVSVMSINENRFSLVDYTVTDALYTYRAVGVENSSPTDKDYSYSNWVRCGETVPYGYSFDNYMQPLDQWGVIITPDDLRYTYMWGTDFRATNGQIFTDEQIEYFIEASIADMERYLNLTIKKKRIRSNPEIRKLVKGHDYDIAETFTDYKERQVQKYVVIPTNYKPINKLHRLTLVNRSVNNDVYSDISDLTNSCEVMKNQGIIKCYVRPYKSNNTTNNIQTAIGMFGNETWQNRMGYMIDYDAGWESATDVPADLREVIAKQAAISLLNVIGDGLMSGFSSSSLSMDGMSESFSSTQSATSAYFGARIQVYKDDIKNYKNDVKRKFGYIAIGCI